MPSTYTDSNGFEKIGTGEQSGSWGTTTNTNFDLLDEALDGQVRVTLSAAGTTGSPNDISMSDGVSSDGRNRWIEVYSASDLGANIYVRLAPNNAKKIVYFRNSLDSARSVVVFQGTYSAPNSVTIANGEDAILMFDGGGSGAIVSKVQQNVSVTSLTDGTATLTGGALTGATLSSPTITSPTITGANAGITSGTITGITGSGTWTLTSDVIHNDGVRAYFGTGSDMQIYYSGGNGFVQAAAGDMRLIGNNVRVQGGTITLTNEAATENMALFTENGAATLYYDNSAKLATTTNGVAVTGTLSTTAGITATTIAGTALSGSSVTATGAVSAGSFTGAGFLDEDTMSSNSATKVASQQSIKAYVDTEVATAVSYGALASVGTLSGNTEWTMVGIPTGYNHLLIQFDEVSLSGADNMLVQLRVGGSYVTTGYTSVATTPTTGGSSISSSTSGIIMKSGLASYQVSGTMLISRYSGTGGTWYIGNGTFNLSSTFNSISSGRVATSGQADGVKILMTGANTFDGGKISMRFWK